MARVFVLDAMGLAYRAYYAFIRRPLVNSRGENTSAIFGFANTALKIRREEQPDYWALAWDGPGPTFRHERFPSYKATRKPMPDDLLAQIPAIEDLARALGLPIVEESGVEADDVMATLARRGAAAGHEVALVTSDKDLVQLVNASIRLLSPVGRGEEYTWVDAAAVEAKWGVPPEQVRDVLALMGDTSDNIPGVPGVGEKTAVELIKQFGSLPALYERLDQVGRGSVREKLAANRELAFLSRELVTVKTDVPLADDWEALRCGPIRREELMELARRYELARLERIALDFGEPGSTAGPPPPARAPERRGTAAEMRGTGVPLREEPAPRAVPMPPLPAPAPAPAPAPEPAPASHPIAVVEAPTLFGEAEQLEPRLAPVPVAPPALSPPVAERQGTLDLWSDSPVADPALALERLVEPLHEVRARALHGLAILPIGTGEDPRRDTLVGLALAARDGTTAYLPLAHETAPNFSLAQVREWLGPVLADRNVAKVGFDLKRDLHHLAGAGIRLRGAVFDLGLGSFLCDPMRSHRMPALARDFLGLELPPLEPPDAMRRGRARATFASMSLDDAETVARAWAGALFPLERALRAQLDAREQWRVYLDLEHPLIPVLADMERAGVAVDLAVLADLSARAAVEIDRLRIELLQLAGEEINLDSGPQVARVLFEKLQLKPGGKTPSGALSTRSDVLEELALVHPFPARLLEYRALTKLRSTYYDALPVEVDPNDGRIHTSFNQAGAATGRLSSYNPNLQNIPIRTAQGRAIRRAFVAPPGNILVGADYSQIELRVMAHLSGDPNLIGAFESGEDVHANTARRIFGIPDGPLDPELRSRAKIVNFGVMYGMGARSLSQQMGIGLTEAQEFIRNYFRVYARVQEFIHATIEQARSRGYVQTLLGRRWNMPGLERASGGEQAFAERAAINAPIQGSAADLMKLAMVRVHRALKRARPSARLLLQVHDELLLESPLEDADAVSAIVQAEMEGCFPLRVPLTVSLGRGPTWFDVH